MSMSLNTAISAYAAMANSARLNTEPHVTRRRRISDCSGAPSSARNRPRTSSSSTSCVRQRGARPPRHRRLLHVRQHGQQPVIAERPPRCRGGPVLADEQQRHAQDLGPVLQHVGRFCGDRGRREIAEADRAVLAGDEPVEVDPAVGDAGVVEAAEVVPQRVDGRVACRPRPGRERHAIGPDDDERVALPGAAGGDQPGHAHAGAVGEEGHEPFVLDELEAAQAHGALGVAVPGQPPRVGEQLAVPGVTPVHLDRQRPVLRRWHRTAASPPGASTPGPARRR